MRVEGLGSSFMSQLFKLERRWVVGFASAQGCALLSASSAIASEALVTRGANFPAWQSFFIYVLLAGFYVPLYIRHRQQGERDGGRSALDWVEEETASSHVASEATPPPPTCSTTTTESPAAVATAKHTLGRYVLLAVMDTQANYCIVKSFRYTSLTSVTLLDCAAIPFSMALSAAMLGGRYSYKHVVGGVVSVVGLAILVLADAAGGVGDGADDEGSNGVGGGGNNPALGDCLVLIAAALYACSNVMQECLLLDGAPTIEVLAAIGGFGAVVSGLQCLALEANELANLNPIAGAAGFMELFWFALSLFAMYSLVPDVLRRCGAAAFNVGMLSSDLWAVVARVLFFGGFGGSTAALAFGVSFVTVSAGLVIFAAAGDPVPPERKDGRQTRYFEVLDDDETGGGGRRLTEPEEDAASGQVSF